MIEHLTSSATFAVSGATLKADYQPQTGITAVVGENGAGKTFLSIETVRWLLFGKKALRGAAGDYKEAQATGTFLIRDARYQISRGKSEWIKDASGEVQAKGAEKVTEKVVELLGYDLDVFDLCNAATQGNVQKLGDMRPADRKAIIDKVAKLTSAEAAEKACRDEAKGYKREAETLAMTLRAPGDAPTPPANYFPSAQSKADLRILNETVTKAEALRAQVRHVDKPVTPPDVRPTTDTISKLEAEVDAQRVLRADRQRLDSIMQRCRPFSPEKYTEEQLAAAEQRLSVTRAIAERGPAPLLTGPQSEANWAAWAVYDAYRPSDTIECPKCRNQFCPTGVPPQQPAWTKTALREDDARRARHAAPEPKLPDGLDLTQQQIDLSRASAKADAEFEEARRSFDALGEPGVDRSGELATLRRLYHHFEAYDQALVAYDTAVARNATVQRDLDALGHVPSQNELAVLYARLSEAERYEADCRAYDAADLAFKETQAKITEANFLAEEYRLGAVGIADARAVVKAMIAPKISKIATGLIRDMTMGKLQSLVVDDEMEITVGGQKIETLSGAGKTVANLALRVAMGRALVGHTFPVFLADEIDGDLSASRREATLQALVSLKKHMRQIILVTHRGAGIADQVWDVESTQ